MLNTFFKELTTQSNTAFSLGTRFIVFRGRRTRKTRSDFMVLRFWPVELPLKVRSWNFVQNKCVRKCKLTQTSMLRVHSRQQWRPVCSRSPCSSCPGGAQPRGPTPAQKNFYKRSTNISSPSVTSPGQKCRWKCSQNIEEQHFFHFFHQQDLLLLMLSSFQ